MKHKVKRIDSTNVDECIELMQEYKEILTEYFLSDELPNKIGKQNSKKLREQRIKIMQELHLIDTWLSAMIKKYKDAPTDEMFNN
jgi:hypothetical protein